LYLELRKHLGEVFRKLAAQKEAKIEEGHLMPARVHMMISIPPNYSVSQVVGFIRGKSSIRLARVYFRELMARPAGIARASRTIHWRRRNSKLDSTNWSNRIGRWDAPKAHP
jgi:REP element-mobilizing transposase RayT